MLNELNIQRPSASDRTNRGNAQPRRSAQVHAFAPAVAPALTQARLPRWICTISLLLAISLLPIHQTAAAPGKNARSIATIPIPKRAKLQPDKSHISNLSFRKTLRYFVRYLKQSKQPFKQIPTYQARGILIARLLSQAPNSPWLAIQIYKERGRTKLFIVPRPKKTTPKATEHAKNTPSP